jgi:hypothetical protein
MLKRVRSKQKGGLSFNEAVKEVINIEKTNW